MTYRLFPVPALTHRKHRERSGRAPGAAVMARRRRPEDRRSLMLVG